MAAARWWPWAGRGFWVTVLEVMASLRKEPRVGLSVSHLFRRMNLIQHDQRGGVSLSVFLRFNLNPHLLLFQSSASLGSITQLICSEEP